MLHQCNHEQAFVRHNSVVPNYLEFVVVTMQIFKILGTILLSKSAHKFIYMQGPNCPCEKERKLEQDY